MCTIIIKSYLLILVYKVIQRRSVFLLVIKTQNVSDLCYTFKNILQLH